MANVISSDSAPQLSYPSECETTTANLVLNARVASSPEVLRELTEATVIETCRRFGAEAEFQQTQSFRPGRPVPTHRYARDA